MVPPDLTRDNTPGTRCGATALLQLLLGVRRDGVLPRRLERGGGRLLRGTGKGSEESNQQQWQEWRQSGGGSGSSDGGGGSGSGSGSGSGGGGGNTGGSGIGTTDSSAAHAAPASPASPAVPAVPAAPASCGPTRRAGAAPPGRADRRPREKGRRRSRGFCEVPENRPRKPAGRGGKKRVHRPRRFATTDPPPRRRGTTPAPPARGGEGQLGPMAEFKSSQEVSCPPYARRRTY